jgi:hypothetical protein
MKTIGALVIASAIIWAAVIIGCSYALQDSECYNQIKTILVGGVLAHILIIWGPMALIFRKTKG